MKILVQVLFITSIFYFVHGRTYHHRHRHHHHDSNPSIALPPKANHRAEEPSLPPTLSPQNSTNSISNNTSPLPSPRNSLPPPSYPTNSTNSTANNVSPIPSPRNSNSTSRPIYISPAPSPGNDNRSANSENSKVVYNVKSFGAVGDGVSDDTEAFKSAWDSACQTGSAAVLAPKGYKFMIRLTIFAGPCQNGVIFQVDGTIMPPDGPDSWPTNNNKRQWLVFYRVDGMAMQGGGLIDGKGEKWWNLPCKPHKGINGTTLPGPCDSPALRFFMSSNLTVQRLRIQNSPQFHFRFDGCHNVTIDSISISSPALSPNTDGIHVENTDNVGIYNSVISNGDDCISIGSGSLNVDIRNVTCGPSHGIRH